MRDMSAVRVLVVDESAEWQAFVTTQIEQGVPVLGALLGQPWPIDKTVEVREAYTPYLYGYAGWFSASPRW